MPTTSGGSPPIILIDTIGELSAIWGLADVAFVGGSLRAGRGGQNMMEPAAYGASVMFGPHIANFRETVEQLLKRNAARQVADAEELTRGLLADLDDPGSRRGARCRRPRLRAGPARGRRPDPRRARPPGRILGRQPERLREGAAAACFRVAGSG